MDFFRYTSCLKTTFNHHQPSNLFRPTRPLPPHLWEGQIRRMAFGVRHGPVGTWSQAVGIDMFLSIFFVYMIIIWTYSLCVQKYEFQTINASCVIMCEKDMNMYVYKHDTCVSKWINRSVPKKFRGFWYMDEFQVVKFSQVSWETLNFHPVRWRIAASFNEKTQNHPGWWILLTLVLDATEAKPGFFPRAKKTGSKDSQGTENWDEWKDLGA